MRLSKFTKNVIIASSIAIAPIVLTSSNSQVKLQTVHAASTDDSGVSTWNDWGTIKWGIDNNGTLWIKPQSGTEGTIGSFSGKIRNNIITENTVPWFSKAADIKSVRMEGTISNGSSSEMSFLFAGLTNCIDIDISNLKIDMPCSLKLMFAKDTNLQKITGLDKFDTSNVTNMYSMFSDCSSLTNLNVSNWNTSKVTNMGWMFSGCSNLTDLDVSDWNTSTVTNMSTMFQNCKALTNLDVSKWETSNVTDMSWMFNYCSNLNNLNVSNWNTNKVTDMNSMFSNCSSLTNLNVSNWNTSNVTDMSWMFNGCSNLNNLNVSNWNTNKVTDMNRMFQSCSTLTNLDVSKWDTSKVTDMSKMFNGCSNLNNLNVSNWNTSKVTDMSKMFQSCSTLTNLDVSKWETSNVTDMSSMFDSCSKLTNLDVSKWETSNVTNMSWMFFNGSSLTNLDVSKWDTSKVTNMYAMFYDCSSLANLDVSNWNTSVVTNMSFMFRGCSSLTKLDLSNWDTSAVTNMSVMLYGCNKLSELKLGKKFTIPSGQNTYLSDPSKKGEYTGRWSKADGSNGMSASDMLNLTGQEHDATGKSLSKTLTQEDRAGTWVWERGYTVTLDPNGGNGSAKTLTAVLSQDQVFGKDSASAYISDPGYTRKAYKSNGANEKKDGTGTEYQYPFTLKTSSDKTIYAQWKAHTGTVTYNANGSTIGTSSKTGWSIAKDGTILLDGKAHHVLNGPNQAETENIAYGTQYDLIDVNNPAYLNLLRTGYHIDEHQEWNTAANGSGTVFDERKPYLAQQLIPSLENTDNAALTVYANWKPNAYTVKFDANGGAGVMADEAMTYDEAKNLTANSYTRKGYTFTGWNTKADGEGTSYTNKASAKNLTSVNNGTVTLYAQWKKTSWYDSGMNKTDPSDNDLHDPDTYIVTIPTKILKTGMSVGNVTKSISYDVNVTGNIPNGNYVHIAASTNNKLTGKNGNLELSVKQGKTVWNKTEAYGIINQDGSLSGTTALDTITINGIAKSVDRYTGLVTYSASLSTSEK